MAPVERKVLPLKGGCQCKSFNLRNENISFVRRMEEHLMRRGVYGAPANNREKDFCFGVVRWRNLGQIV